MKLAIIVLNYKNYNDTVVCVDKLLEIGVNADIVIVDNASPNESYKILSEKYNECNNISIIASKKNGGYSAGNNYGVRYALDKFESDTIAIMNPDIIIPDANVIERLYSKLYSSNEFGIIGGVAITNNKFDINRCCWNIPKGIDTVITHFIKCKNQRGGSDYIWLNNGLIQTECIAGCFFMIKADVFCELGLFDENVFLYNEENILGIKLKKRGLKAVVSLEDFYYHNHDYGNNEDRGFINKVLATKNTFKSRRYMCKKYYSAFLLPLLYGVEGANRIYLACCYIWKRILRR